SIGLAESTAMIGGQAQAAGEPAGVPSTTMYRDDLRGGSYRAPEPTRIPAAVIHAKTVVLVDDVLFSVRTIRAGLDALSDVGRPARVRLAIPADCGHHELPDCAGPEVTHLRTPTS